MLEENVAEGSSNTSEVRENNDLELSSESKKQVFLEKVKSVGSSQQKCFICGSKTGRKRIPGEALAHVWSELHIFVPKSNRCCSSHLTGNIFSNEALELIDASKEGIILNDEEITEWMKHIKISSNRKTFNFDDDVIDDEDFIQLTGFSKEQFHNLLPFLNQINSTKFRSKKNALAIFLMMLRHNLSQVCIYIFLFLNSFAH